MADLLAFTKGGLVLRSLSHANSTCTMAPATAAQPNTGLAKNRITMKTSETGASMTAPTTGCGKKSRTVRKSFIGWMLGVPMRRRLVTYIA